MKHDKHSQEIPESVLKQAQQSLDQAIEAILPYAIALTPVERRDIPKMGEKTLSFVEKAHEFAVKNPNLCPPYLDMKAFRIDFSDAHNLWTLMNTSRQLQEMISDTVMTAGSEAYQDSLVFYNSAKMAAAQDVPGARAVYEELRKRFPRIRRHSLDAGDEPVITEE